METLLPVRSCESSTVKIGRFSRQSIARRAEPTDLQLRVEFRHRCRCSGYLRACEFTILTFSRTRRQEGRDAR